MKAILMNAPRNLLAAAALSLAIPFAFAQQAVPSAGTSASAPAPWKYKTRQLDRAQVDKLLAQPGKLVVIDVRRPDELVVKGSFPAYLNIQTGEIEKNIAYIPKDRAVLTVSNHAHRAGVVGDLLSSKGFKVAGATGSEDYEAQGGTAVVRVKHPVKAVSATAPVAP